MAEQKQGAAQEVTTKTCPRCKRIVPAECISDMAIGLKYVRMCAICALESTNKIHGLPLDTPFRGPVAQALYERAIAFNQEESNAK